MESLTKRRLSPSALDAVLRRALGSPLAGHRELTDGMFNTAYRLTTADGRDCVLKLAPPPGAPLLTYERGLMRTEAMAFARMAEHGLPVPEVLLAEDDLLLMTALRGLPWSAAQPADRERLRGDLGALVRRLHGITGDRFGYPQGPSGRTWSAAFLAMTDAVLADADRFGVAVPDLRPHFHARAALLDEVTTPVPVHFDLWEGNIFLHEGRIEGVIDPERAFWGDPLAEFASTSLFADLDAAFLSGHGSPAPTGRLRERLLMYRAYLCLIMIVEGVPRGYGGPEHEGRVRFYRAKLAEYTVS
ncbi:phosphotransferase family protein [Actinokineospora sp. 24-640]